MTKPIQGVWVDTSDGVKVLRLGRFQCQVEQLYEDLFGWEVEFTTFSGGTFDTVNLAGGSNKTKDKAKTECIKRLISIHKDLGVICDCVNGTEIEIELV